MLAFTEETATTCDARQLRVDCYLPIISRFAAFIAAFPAIATNVTCVVRPSVCPSVTLAHAAETVRRNETSFGRDTVYSSSGSPYLTLPYLRGGQVVTPAQR